MTDRDGAAQSGPHPFGDVDGGEDVDGELAVVDQQRRARPPIPWRRLVGLMRPVRPQLLAMVALTVAGAVAGLVPAFALGSLVDALAAGGAHRGATLDVVLILAAVATEAIAFAVSDGFFSTAVARLYRDLRVLMFAGARRSGPRTGEQLAGLSARFVSDAEALEELIVSPLDTTVMALSELVSSIAALIVLDPLGAAVALGGALLGAAVVRVTQRPAAAAAEERQEALEAMSVSLAVELCDRIDERAASERFRTAASGVLRREAHLGWLEAGSRYSATAVASLGPIAVVLVAALSGSFKAGTLLSIMLIAGRVYSAFDDLVEIGLDVELVRGAVRRCFELVDADGGDGPGGPPGTGGSDPAGAALRSSRI
ncbi:MAG: ABC transporter transmembrane domain-containing protein [Solirubrobacteraceae bacterium]